MTEIVTTAQSEPQSPAPTVKYVLQVNPYTIMAAEIGAILNILGVVITADTYVTLEPAIAGLFKPVN